MLKRLATAIAFTAVCHPLVVSAQSRTNPILDKVVSELVAAVNAKDPTRVTSLYAEDAVLMPPDMPMVKGRAAIEAHFKKEFGAVEMTMQLTPMESTISGGQGVGIGTSTVTVKRGGISSSPAGGSGPTTTDAGKYVLVFKGVGSDWKIAFDIFNSDRPTPPPK